MSKLACECGSVLSDVYQDDSDRYWGVIYPNGEENKANEEASKEIASLVTAISGGEGEKWLKEYFGSDYPTDMDLSSYVSDILSRCFLEKGLAYGRCQQCISLLIQNDKNSHLYNNYVPSGKNSVGI